MKLNIQRFAVTKSTTFAESDVSIEGNTSTLKITIKFSPNNTSTYFSSKTLNCTCNGVKKTASVSLSKGGSVSKTFTFTGIQHNTDGTKSVSWSWSCATGTSVLGTISDSGTKALTTIQRYAKITSVSGFSTDSTIAVSYHSYSANYTYELFVQYGEEGASFKIYENIDGSVGDHTLNITVENSYFNVYPNDTSAEIVYGITTFIDATTSYDDTYLTTIELRPNVIPSATIGTLTEADSTMQDLNWRDGNNKPIFVQNHSKLYIPVTGSGINNSTIKKLQIYIQNQSWSKENSTSYTFTSNTLTTSGSNSIKAIATDSRNRDNSTNPTYKTFNVVEYSNPKIEIAQAQRCRQDGTLDDDGTYVKFSFSGSISPCSNHNDSTFIISYKKTTDEYYTSVNLSTAYSINVSNQISSFTISKDYTYDIKFSAVDSFTTTEIVRTLDTGFDLLNFNSSGKAMAIGKVSEASSNEEKLEVALHTTFIPDTDMYSSIEIDSSNRNEASITYYNETKTKGYVAGYGTASFDGFGIYSHETAQNILTINKDGQLNLADDTSWTQLTMESGFQQVSWNPLKVKRKCGIVQIIGMFEITSMTSWVKTIANLPAGFRPANEMNVVCRNASGGLAIIGITNQSIIWLNQDGVGDISSGTIVLTATYIGES